MFWLIFISNLDPIWQINGNNKDSKIDAERGVQDGYDN